MQLAGKIETAEQHVARRRASLANLDAALLLFDTKRDPTLISAVRPKLRCLYFRARPGLWRRRRDRDRDRARGSSTRHRP